jgi:cell division protein FtsZ
MKEKNEVFELTDGQTSNAVIRVIGVGGGGCNTVNQMARAGIQEVDFICANTDKQHLERCVANTVLQLGPMVTRGLGAGSNPDVGKRAAEEDKDRIRELIEGTDMLFVTAGMGGGTGTGAAPVIAEIAKDMGILTVAVVTKPFGFEGKKRMAMAVKGIDELERHVDSLILIPNDKLQMVMGPKATLAAAFKAANDVLQNAVQGISDLITRPGLQNVDFADVRNVMLNRGKAMMGLGNGSGENRADLAVEMALSSPLLDDILLSNARGVLVNITCDSTLNMDEINHIMNRVQGIASEDVDVKFGTSLDEGLNGELRVTVVATGLGSKIEPERKPVVVLVPRAGTGTDGIMVGVRGMQEAISVPSYQMGRKERMMPAELHRLELDDDVINVPTFLRQQAD